jgi:hypothetical protein
VLSLSLIFNQYVNPIALKKLGWKYYIIYVVFIVFEFIYCYLFVVETKGLTLEETAALFDGEQATAHITRRAADEVMIDEREEKEAYTPPPAMAKLDV